MKTESALARIPDATDVEKLKAYIAALLAVPTPAVTDPVCAETVQNLIADLNYYMEGAERL